MKIAIFGGSFNPVHTGHYEIVQRVNERFEFQKIIVVPAYRNPLKDTLPKVPTAIRLKMLEETFIDTPNVTISDYELKKKQTSYTFQTLEYFRQRYPQHSLFLVIGEDSFNTFHLWAKADRIIELSQLLVFYRPGMADSKRQGIRPPAMEKVRWMDVEIPRISSTQIREADLETVICHQWLHKNALKTWQRFKTQIQENPQEKTE